MGDGLLPAGGGTGDVRRGRGPHPSRAGRRRRYVFDILEKRQLTVKEIYEVFFLENPGNS
jgi:hypothetical protein